MKLKFLKKKLIFGFIPHFYTVDSDFDTNDLTFEQQVELIQKMHGFKI